MPLFFWSYARADRDKHLDRFYADVVSLVRAKSGLGSDAEVTFRDVRSVALGERWSDEIRMALATSKAMICLLSPTYFNRAWCRKEYVYFLDRVAKSTNDGKVPPLIIPIRWFPETKASGAFSNALSSLQHDADFGDEYEREGLQYICRLKKYGDLYQDICTKIANRIIEVTAQYSLPDARAPEDTEHGSEIDTTSDAELRDDATAYAIASMGNVPIRRAWFGDDWKTLVEIDGLVWSGRLVFVESDALSMAANVKERLLKDLSEEQARRAVSTAIRWLVRVAVDLAKYQSRCEDLSNHALAIAKRAKRGGWGEELEAALDLVRKFASRLAIEYCSVERPIEILKRANELAEDSAVSLDLRYEIACTIVAVYERADKWDNVLEWLRTARELLKPARHRPRGFQLLFENHARTAFVYAKVRLPTKMREHGYEALKFFSRYERSCSPSPRMFEQKEKVFALLREPPK